MSSQTMRKACQNATPSFSSLLSLLGKLSGLVREDFIRLDRRTIVHAISRRRVARGAWRVQLDQLLDVFCSYFKLEAALGAPVDWDDVVQAIQQHLRHARQTSPCGDVKELLFAYLVNALNAPAMGMVREHVAHCDSCSLEVAQMTEWRPLPMSEEQRSPRWREDRVKL